MTPSQTFHDHVKELRHRVLWCVLAIGISAGIAYGFHLPLIRFMQHPVGVTLYYNSPAGSFNFILKLATLIGMFVALPVMIYNLIRFIEPALPVNITRRTMMIVISSSFCLALGGMAFSFFYLLPMSLEFFGDFATDQIKPLISAGEYLSFLLGHLMTFALMFQIPLVVLFINWITPIKPGKMLRYQRYVIVGAFGLALVLPFTYDPVSQFIVAIPIVILYYVSVILLTFANRGKSYAKDSNELVPQSLPKPLLEPVFDIASVPVAAATNTALPKRHYNTVDGFIGRPSQALAPSLQVNQLDIARTKEPEIKITQPALPRPKLAIDGISRPLATYF